MTRTLLAAIAAFALGALTLSAPVRADEAATERHGADAQTLGDLHLFGFFIFETPPNARNAGGFLSIHNHGGEDRLLAAGSPAAQRVELHTMTMDGDVMRMRELEDGIAVPADGLVELAPGGLHLMFIGINEALSPGDAVSVSLTFESAGTIEVSIPVIARTMEGGHGGHDPASHDQSHERMN